ncbi:MAG: FAD-dependent oxidoreductase [Brevundimonas sp.]
MTLMRRRNLLLGAGALGLGACSSTTVLAPAPAITRQPLPRLHLSADRIVRITVCSRPFRPAGPRIEAEALGAKRLVHNYGHGGSGWSLSWGSAEIARDLALSGGVGSVAVIGCGAIGLTTATLLQRAGATVTVYASERLPETRSARATGLWTPDSRIADADRVDAAFPAVWERMARASWAMHQTYVGQPAEPVAFLDRYGLGGVRAADPATGFRPEPAAPPVEIRFAGYGSRLTGLTPRSRPLAPDQHDFQAERVRVAPEMQFNIAELSRRLIADFQADGGRIEARTFHAPADLAGLSEPVIVNCTGYGARALFGDDTLVPVRGQMAWLPPQPEVRYGFYGNGVSVMSRPDGVGVQRIAGDMFGHGVDNESVDMLEAQDAILRAAAVFAPTVSAG